MFNISQSCDRTFDVNCGTLSEVIISSTPKQVIQEKTKARVHTAANVSERGIASIHLDVRSMIVKMWLQPLLYCKGPTRSMWRWANRHWGMGMGCGSRWVLQWILLPSQCRQDFAQLVTLLARLCQKNLEDSSGQPPRRGNAVQMQKKSFRNFAGTMGWKTPVETSPTRHWAPCLGRPGRYNICKLYSEMKAKWRCCYGDWGKKRETKRSQEVCDLSTIEKRNLLQKWRKYLIAACAANNSRSNVE